MIASTTLSNMLISCHQLLNIGKFPAISKDNKVYDLLQGMSISTHKSDLNNIIQMGATMTRHDPI